MQYQSSIFAMVGFLALEVYSLVPYSASNFTSAAASRFDNFTVVDITWDVEITPGGNTTNVTGTIQTIYDEMVKINPNFMAHYPPKSPIHNRTLYTRSTSTGYDPCAPSNNNITDWNCNLGSNSGVIWCSTGIIKEEIKYLRGISGKPRNGPGPSECGRVSCEWSAAIYWCNDSNKAKTLSSFADIAEGAEYVVHKCAGYDGVRGQTFFLDDWNVIVKGEKC